MSCRDCGKEIIEKKVTHQNVLGEITYVCQDCVQNYNTFLKHDGKDRDFCEKCGNKFLREDLFETTFKKVKMLVCRNCSEV
jgi:DNA-directed RNA polymerase subunit RPC12/RpoP